MSHTTFYTYDGNQNLLTLTNPLSHTTTYTYNANGDLAGLTDPLGHETQYTYNTLGDSGDTIPNSGIFPLRVAPHLRKRTCPSREVSPRTAKGCGELPDSCGGAALRGTVPPPSGRRYHRSPNH